jgi:hypothetical protein
MESQTIQQAFYLNNDGVAMLRRASLEDTINTSNNDDTDDHQRQLLMESALDCFAASLGMIQGQLSTVLATGDGSSMNDINGNTTIPSNASTTTTTPSVSSKQSRCGSLDLPVELISLYSSSSCRHRQHQPNNTSAGVAMTTYYADTNDTNTTNDAADDGNSPSFFVYSSAIAILLDVCEGDCQSIRNLLMASACMLFNMALTSHRIYQLHIRQHGTSQALSRQQQHDSHGTISDDDDGLIINHTKRSYEEQQSQLQLDEPMVFPMEIVPPTSVELPAGCVQQEQLRYQPHRHQASLQSCIGLYQSVLGILSLTETISPPTCHDQIKSPGNADEDDEDDLSSPLILLLRLATLNNLGVVQNLWYSQHHRSMVQPQQCQLRAGSNDTSSASPPDDDQSTWECLFAWSTRTVDLLEDPHDNNTGKNHPEMAEVIARDEGDDDDDDPVMSGSFSNATTSTQAVRTSVSSSQPPFVFLLDEWEWHSMILNCIRRGVNVINNNDNNNNDFTSSIGAQDDNSSLIGTHTVGSSFRNVLLLSNDNNSSSSNSPGGGPTVATTTGKGGDGGRAADTTDDDDHDADADDRVFRKIFNSSGAPAA